MVLPIQSLLSLEVVMTGQRFAVITYSLYLMKSDCRDLNGIRQPATAINDHHSDYDCADITRSAILVLSQTQKIATKKYRDSPDLTT